MSGDAQDNKRSPAEPPTDDVHQLNAWSQGWFCSCGVRYERFDDMDRPWTPEGRAVAERDHAAHIAALNQPPQAPVMATGPISPTGRGNADGAA